MAKTQSDFPVTIDATLQTDRASGDTITSDSYDIIEDALFELETKVGVDSSAVTGSIDYMLKNHKVAHQDGGSDEISVAGLSGLLADPQTPKGDLIGEGHITIIAIAYDSLTQGTWAVGMDQSYPLNFEFYNTSNAQNDQVDYKAFLAAGTYTFVIYYYRAGNRAIATLLIDDESVGTLDMYGGAQPGTRGGISDIVISTAGLKTISFKGATRNASSTGWFLSFHSISIYRTA